MEQFLVWITLAKQDPPSDDAMTTRSTQLLICFCSVVTQFCPSWALTQPISLPTPHKNPLANSSRLFSAPPYFPRKPAILWKPLQVVAFILKPHLTSQAGELEFGSSLSLPDYSSPSLKKILPILGLCHCVPLTYLSLLVEETAKYSSISDSPL